MKNRKDEFICDQCESLGVGIVNSGKASFSNKFCTKRGVYLSTVPDDFKSICRKPVIYPVRFCKDFKEKQ